METPKPTKKIFDSIEEAKHAIAHDKLATVYVRADKVFVVTAYGSGTFNRIDWEAKMGGYKWR